MIITIRNIETNKIFRLEEKEATRVLTSNREKFVIVGEEHSIGGEQPIDEEETKKTYNFSKMKLAELQDYCKDNEIEFNENATKKELVALIEGNK